MIAWECRTWDKCEVHEESAKRAQRATRRLYESLNALGKPNNDHNLPMRVRHQRTDRRDPMGHPLSVVQRWSWWVGRVGRVRPCATLHLEISCCLDTLWHHILVGTKQGEPSLRHHFADRLWFPPTRHLGLCWRTVLQAVEHGGMIAECLQSAVIVGGGCVPGAGGRERE